MRKALAASVTVALVLLLAGGVQASSPAQKTATTSRPGNPAQAKPDAQAAIRSNNIGAAYMNQQAFEKALQQFQRAYAADPKLLVARLNQGIALLNLQKPGQAKPILEEIAKQHPGHPRAWYNLGLLYKSAGDFAAARHAFHQASELAPHDAYAFYFLGLSYLQTGDNKDALEAFKRALELSPFHASAEFGMARAYQQMGNLQQARVHLARFEHLTQSKLGSPVTLAYGDQGPLSLVATVGTAGQMAGPAIAVKFTDATAEAGLNGTAAAAEHAHNHPLGAGACVLDFDGDGNPDLLLTGFGPNGGVGLFQNDGSGKFTDVTKEAGLGRATAATACAAADYDNDGKTDLALAYPDQVVLYHNLGGKFAAAIQPGGLKTKLTSRGLLWVDYDHDGDADLYVTDAGAGGHLWRNNGNSTFTDVTADTAMTFPASGTSAIASDVNNDRAVDIIVTRAADAPVLFTNPREGKWPASTPWPGGMRGANAITSLDFNKDGWMDLAMATDAAPGLILLRNADGNKFEAVSLPSTGWTRGTSVVAFDYDNDGFVDLIATGILQSGRPEIRLFRNLGGDKFEDVTASTGLNGVHLKTTAFLTAADFDGDGDVDLAVTEPGSGPILLNNDGGNQNHSLRIGLRGLADNRSGLGTKVEVFAGDLWQKWEVDGGGGPGQSSEAIVAGLGKRSRVDIVRLLWPTGVIQDEIDVPINKPKEILEIDRRGSSCPVLFAWNGKRYQFISDMIGAGVVGHWIGPGERNVPDPTEYLKLSGAIVKQRDGHLSFRFMEPMEEVVYLDQVRLLAVDHPSAYQVHPNEYFASNPPFPRFKVISSNNADLRPPAGAWDDHGRDVLRHLLRSDHDYVSGFRRLHFSGYAEPHWLELDLGEPYEGGTLRLLLHGFIEYFTATSMYAAHQAGLDPVAPYVEAQDANGKWVRVVDDMGFPAGLPRTTVADLTGKLPLGTRRIRIATNLQIYWDQIRVDRTPSAGPVRVVDVPLSSARLIDHGYPRDIERQTNARGDHYYVYEEVSKTGPYSREEGAYTRLGDVKRLLTKVDDRFAVFGSGDAIELEFDPLPLPPLPDGWVRDYFFFADGYEKDMDFYAADGLTVNPLPYREMERYPYPEQHGFLRSGSSVNYLLDYNTRFFTGNPSGVRSSYRFK